MPRRGMIRAVCEAGEDGRLAGCQQGLFLRKQRSCDFCRSQQNGNTVGNGNTFTTEL